MSPVKLELGRRDYSLQCLGAHTSRGQGVDDSVGASASDHVAMCELFSGSGNVSDYFRRAGKAVASFDKMLGGKAMDVAKVAGFLFGTQVPSVYM